MLEKRKFRSVVTQVMVYPVLIYMFIVVFVVLGSIGSFFQMQQQMVSSTVSSLQISINQLDNVMQHVDSSFVNYWVDHEAHRYMKSYTKETPNVTYVVHQAAIFQWLEEQVSANTEVEGAFLYYENMDVLMMRGASNKIFIQGYIKEQVRSDEREFNCWELATINDKQYLLVFKKYGGCVGGVWIPFSKLEKYLNVEETKYLGTTYLADSKNKNSLSEIKMKVALEEYGWNSDKIALERETFYNYTVSSSKDIHIGILISKDSIWKNLSNVTKMMIGMAIVSILMAPVLLFWLREKIAKPVRGIDEGLQRIGEGDLEYRLPLWDTKHYNEFDRLMSRFNETLDQLHAAEYNLYKSKINQQRTQLKYVSQQIRPHFILNALNIIYTYEEHEFPLVKKMVLYLTEYFRYIVNLRRDFVEVEKEMRHVENYLLIQKERYLDRFDFFVEWEAQVKDELVPPLIIQTFVENCIKYGIKGEEKTFVYVLASKENDKLRLMIADTGNGFPEEKMEQIKTFIRTREYDEGLGVGIQNAIERMDILYERKVDVIVRNALSGGAVIELHLPILEKEEVI